MSYVNNMRYAGFDLTTGDSYFTTLVEVFKNHILAKNILANRIE